MMPPTSLSRLNQRQEGHCPDWQGGGVEGKGTLCSALRNSQESSLPREKGGMFPSSQPP